MSAPVVGFAGLTHLGLVSALALASKGFRVVGYDSDAARVRDIAAGRLPVVEPGLDELARGCAQRISFSSQVKDLGACDLVYISTDVPTDDRGESDLSGISASIAQVIASLSPRALLVVLCQVPPGFTRALPLPSERLFYQVETLVFGRAVERATRAERYIIGCADPAKALPEAFAAVLGAFGCPILPMRYESAELAKIAINCCLVASVTISSRRSSSTPASGRALISRPASALPAAISSAISRPSRCYRRRRVPRRASSMLLLPTVAIAETGRRGCCTTRCSRAKPTR
jgi:UDPglucose 6-dehydrogenase